MSIERINSEILQKYSLCESCYTRQFSFTLKDTYNFSNNNILNLKNEVKKNQNQSCFICGQIMSSIPKYTKLVINALHDYEFTSLVIGARIPTAIIEREDNMRAELKLKGGETLKANFTRDMNITVSEQLKTQVNHKNPDVTVIIDLLLNKVEISSRSIFVYGRYIKNKRGISQKQRKCQDCKGKGCLKCTLTGFTTLDSVEQRLTIPLLQLFNADRIKFSWVGSEDMNSLVLGKGRPFYAEILEPKIRKRKQIKSALKKNIDDIFIRDLKLIVKRPRGNQHFSVIVRSSLKLNKQISKTSIRNLQEMLKETSVQIISSNKNKIITKTIYYLIVESVNKCDLQIVLECDGGLSIRRFLTGENDEISPNLSEILKRKITLNKEKPFDILDVNLKS